MTVTVVCVMTIAIDSRKIGPMYEEKRKEQEYIKYPRRFYNSSLTAPPHFQNLFFDEYVLLKVLSV